MPAGQSNGLHWAASIVPPPFGSGYVLKAVAGILINSVASIVPPPFGSGYLAASVVAGALRLASIVPPPFGSGYQLGRNGETH